jgi:hypothetical protein
MPKINKWKVRVLFINVCLSQPWISGNDSKPLLAQRTSMTNIQNSADCVNLLLCITYYHKSVHSPATLSTLQLPCALSSYPEHSPATLCTLQLPCALSGYPVHSPATLTEVSPCFSSVVRQMPGCNSQTGHGPHSSQLVVNCVVLWVVNCVVLCTVYV